MLHQEVTGIVIKAFYKVYNSLGYGFSEKVYENSLVIELNKTDLAVQQQFPIKVLYGGKEVGEYFADLLIENKVIVELKSVENLTPKHEAQLINYLKATNIEVGLLLNFGPEAKFLRKLFTNDQKR